MTPLRIASLSALKQMKVLPIKEAMVKLNDRLACYPKNPDMAPYTGEEIWVREAVCNRLLAAQESLSKIQKSFQLLIYYGYRHPEIQTRYYEQMYARTKEQYPNEPAADLEERVNLMIAYPPIAGHPTGGAVDLTILDGSQELDMGCPMYDFNQLEKVPTFSPHLSTEQKQHRKLLHDALKTEGFAPFYGEWWHFSFGDREWAVFYDNPHAIYDQLTFRTVEPGKIAPPATSFVIPKL